MIKLSHHGAYSNNYAKPILPQARIYVVSTNGRRREHPDRSLLAQLAMHSDFNQFHFNYAIDGYELFYREEQQEKYNYSISFGSELFIHE